ncbi:MAG: DUF4430 domain-containing protein [Thermoplasmatota archaeon]
MDLKCLIRNTRNPSSYLSDIIILGIFVLIGVLGRTILVSWNIQPFPNFEIIMVLTFLAALFISPTLAFFVPLGSMIGSDLLLGNPIFIGSQMNKIVLFTYSGFLILSLMNILARNKIRPHVQQIKIRTVGLVVGVGLACTICYDVWTNIGWWYLMYPHTIETLASVFFAGIPFMLYHLLSTAVTFIVIGIPVIMLINNKHTLPIPKHISLHHLPVVAVTLLFIGLSFSGTAMDVPRNTDIWLEHADSTSVTVIIQGNDWTFTDTICVTEETTVLWLLSDVSDRHGIEVETTYYESFDATIVTSISDDVNGYDGHYWQYSVNGKIPIHSCDTCTVSNGDVIIWSFETMKSDI